MSNGKSITVHAEGQEGTLQVEALTGAILTPINERPEWSEGLATAVIQERNHFYETRLGKDSEECKAILSATAVNKDDLGWIVVDAEQEAQELDASTEFRMDTVAKALGIDRDTGNMGQDVVAEREVSRETIGMSQAEQNALDESVAQGFQGEDTRKQAEKNRATGG